MMPSLQSRRDEEKELRRQSIIDAAEELLATKTWAETNFSDIARFTRLSRSLIYVYFPTKEDLFDAICNRGAVVLEGIFREALGAEKTGLDQVEGIARAYHKFSRDYPVYFKLHAEQGTSEEQGFQAEISDTYSHPAFDLLGAALARGLKDGSINPHLGDPRVTALALWTFTHGLLLIAARKEGFFQEKLSLESQVLVDHGLGMIRRMLAMPAHPAAE